MKDFILGFFKDEDGLETIEMVIILVVLVGMAVIFRNKLATWFNALMKEVKDPTQGGVKLEE